MLQIVSLSEIPKNKVVVMYFFAPWSLYHKETYKKFQKLEEEYKDFSFLMVNVDNLPGLVGISCVTMVPSMAVYIDGKLDLVLNGFNLLPTYRAKLNDIYKKLKETENG